MTATLELDLTGIAHGGEALGRHAGKVIFVPYAIPGERVRVEIIEEKERWARARLLEVLTPGPDRVAPPCPYFGPDRCSGCQWQHIAYPRQAELKREIVADQLQRLGRLTDPPVADVVAFADPGAAEGIEQFFEYGYRSHVQFALTPEGLPGFRQVGGYDILPIAHCPLLHERLDELHGSLDIAWPDMTGLAMRMGFNTDDAIVMLQSPTGEEPELELDIPAACALITAAEVKPLIGDPWIEEEVAGRRFRISAGSFFHDHIIGAGALAELVVAYATAGKADVVLDLYCGVGLFSVALSEVAGEVIGVESSATACEDFAQNVGEIANISLHEGSVEAVLEALRSQDELHVDLVVMEPPRTGAGERALRELTALGPPRHHLRRRRPGRPGA